MLRQDPDFCLVGEIRDHETAMTALKLSETGHLVFATLHTNSAAASLPRMLDMGAEPFLIASTVNVIIAQRLGQTKIRNLDRESVCKQNVGALEISVNNGRRTLMVEITNSKADFQTNFVNNITKPKIFPFCRCLISVIQ